jgi:hypothetical protein
MLDDLSWFLTEMAKRYLAGRCEYNAYKHGLRVLAGDGAQLLVDVGRGSGDYRPFLTMGHSISFLEIEKHTNEYAVKEVTKEINEEDSFEAMRIMCEASKITQRFAWPSFAARKASKSPSLKSTGPGF